MLTSNIKSWFGRKNNKPLLNLKEIKEKMLTKLDTRYRMKQDVDSFLEGTNSLIDLLPRGLTLMAAGGRPQLLNASTAP